MTFLNMSIGMLILHAAIVMGLVALAIWEIVKRRQRVEEVKRFIAGVDNVRKALKVVENDVKDFKSSQVKKLEEFETVLERSVTGLESSISRIQEIVGELNGLKK